MSLKDHDKSFVELNTLEKQQLRDFKAKKSFKVNKEFS